MKMYECVGETDEMDEVHFVVKRIDSSNLIELTSRAIHFYTECDSNDGAPILLSKVNSTCTCATRTSCISSRTSFQSTLLRMDEVHSFYACVARWAWKHLTQGFWSRRERRRMVGDILHQVARMVGGMDVAVKYPVKGHQI